MRVKWVGDVLKKLSVLLPICASVTSGCMSTPPLSQATGSDHSEVLIKDVVERVKCEISDAFDQKTEQPQFRWLADWTAHVDLSLAINDNAGISPNGSFTKFEKSALNYDAGKLPSYPVVTQFFSVSAGANFSGQAVRTETVSFTLPLDELKAWREEIDAREALLPPEKKTCAPQSTGLTGNLGLKEWTDSAFYPVEKVEDGNRELYAGVHNASWKFASKPPFPIVAGDKPFNGYKNLGQLLKNTGPQFEMVRRSAPSQKGNFEKRSVPEEQAPLLRCMAHPEIKWELDDHAHPIADDPAHPNKFDQVAQWQRQLKALQTATSSSLSTIESNAQKINTNIQSVITRLEDNQKYKAVMSPFVRAKYERTRAQIEKALKYVEGCADYKQTLDSAQALTETILPSLYQVGTSGNQDNWCNPKYYCANAKDPTDDPSMPTCSTPAPKASAGDATPATDDNGHDVATKKSDPPICRATSCPNAGTADAYAHLKDTMQELQKRAVAAADPKKDAKNASFENGALVCAENLTWLSNNVSIFVSDIPNQIDPPIDSVLHSLQFVISYGANVTPSWTLLQWKGPGQSGNFLSASGIRTHNLQLALGPRSGQASISQDATRLITNQTVKSLGN